MVSKLKLLALCWLLFAQGGEAFFSAYDDYYSSPKYFIKYSDQDFYTNYESERILQGSSDFNGTYHLMKSKNTDYLCQIPQITSSEKQQPALDDENRPQKIKEAFRRIQDSLINICLFQSSGYWTYAFCFGKELSQFNGKVQDFFDNKASKFTLGKFKKLETADDYSLNKEGGLWYLRYNLEGGTTCDLTGRSRSSEIQFVCDPSTSEPKLKWVKEYKSCQYQAQIAVPELCSDDLLGSNKEEKLHEIECKRIVHVDVEVVDKEDYIKHSFYNHPLRISFSDYKLEPLGNGVFLGRPKAAGGLDIIIYKSDEEDEMFLNLLAKGFFNGIAKKKILNDGVPLKGDEEFTFYTYVYGRTGYFLNTVEIVKKSNGEAVIYNRNDLSHLEKNVHSARIKSETKVAETATEDYGTVTAEITEPQEASQQDQDQVQKVLDPNEEGDPREDTLADSSEIEQETHTGQPQEEQIVMKHDEL